MGQLLAGIAIGVVATVLIGGFAVAAWIEKGFRW